MSKSNAMETALMALVFNGTSWPGIADNAAAPNTHLYATLHSADPGDAGSQTTNEASYPGYARVAVIRTATGWAVSGNQSSNAALIQFPACTGGAETVTHFSVGMAASGASPILYSGAIQIDGIDASIAVSNGIQIEFGAGAMTFTED